MATMTYRDVAEQHARAAEASLAEARCLSPISRERMACLNLAKAHATLSQAYSALALSQVEPRVVIR